MADAKPFGTNALLAPVGTVLLLLIAIFARMMTYRINRDEQLYAPPALLLDQLDLYRDFFYNHVPGSAWLFYCVKLALGTDHLLFAARMSVFAAWILIAVSVAWVTIKLTRSITMTLFAVILVLSNDLLLTVAGMAGTNNFLPLPFAYLGMGLFVLAVSDERSRPLMIGASGICLATAASMKANAVAFIPPVAVAALFLPSGLDILTRVRRVLLPLAVGGLIGSLPVLIYFISDPELFLAHVVGFHTGPHVAYWSAQPDAAENVAMAAGAKIRLAFLVWNSGSNLLLIFTAVTFLIVLARDNAPDGMLRTILSGPIILVSAAMAIAVVLSFVPTPSFPQYFAPPIICFALLFALLYDKLSADAKTQVRPVLIAASIVMVAVNLPRLAPGLPRLASPETWTVSRVHESGQKIARLMSGAGVDGKVATLAPIYPLEAGLAVYPELATGQFAFRVAEFTDPELLTHFRTTSPKTIRALFEADPPAAILVGFEPELESPMINYAEQNGYLKSEDLGLQDRYGVGVLYLRPQ